VSGAQLHTTQFNFLLNRLNITVGHHQSTISPISENCNTKALELTSGVIIDINLCVFEQKLCDKCIKLFSTG